MKINIRGQKLEITPAINDHIENKLCKLEKFFQKPEEITINVLAKIRGIEQIIEITIPGKFTIRAEESHNDLYAAIDLAVDKIESQIKKNKSRIKKKYKANEISEYNFAYEEKVEQPEETRGSIIKRKVLELKPMDEDEAVLQMELLNHDFYIFNNIKKDAISVIYRRKDGDYGIIDTVN